MPASPPVDVVDRSRRVSSPQARRAVSRQQRRDCTADLLARAHRASASERQALLDEVVLINRGVAEAVAARYRNRGVAQEDLEQTAYEGLIKAVGKFDPTVRPDLLTYAVPTIRGEIQRYFRDHSWMVRPPRRIQELQWRIGRSVDELSQRLARPPLDAEIQADLGCTEQEFRDAVEGFGCFQPPSLDRTIDGAGTLTLGASIPDDSTDDHASAEARAMLTPLLRQLDPRDQRIVFLRFFEQRSQREIGEDLGVTQMQVSRVLQRIMHDLRAGLTTRCQLAS